MDRVFGKIAYTGQGGDWKNTCVCANRVTISVKECWWREVMQQITGRAKFASTFILVL